MANLAELVKQNIICATASWIADGTVESTNDFALKSKKSRGVQVRRNPKKHPLQRQYDITFRSWFTSAIS